MSKLLLYFLRFKNVPINIKQFMFRLVALKMKYYFKDVIQIQLDFFTLPGFQIGACRVKVFPVKTAVTEQEWMQESKSLFFTN